MYYPSTSIAKDKGFRSLDTKKVTAKDLEKEAGIAIFPRNEDIMWNKGDQYGQRKFYESLNPEKEISYYDEGFDENPFIEPGDFVSERTQDPDILLTEKDAVELVRRLFPEDPTFVDKFGKIKETLKTPAVKKTRKKVKEPA